MGLLDWFRARTPKLDQDRISAALIRETTEYLVKMTDPRLALVGGYRERMSAVVGTTLSYIAEGRALLLPPHELSTTAWSLDPCIKALFVHPEELVEVVSRSAELRSYVDASSATDPVFALLATDIEERKRLGMMVQNGVMMRDVAQTTLNFTNHRLRLFGHSREALWEAISQRVLDELAMVALDLMQSEQATRKELENSRVLLTARLSMFERRGTGVAPFFGESRDTGASLESHDLLRQLDDNEQQLACLGGAEDALQRQLDYLCNVLADPGRHISMWRRDERLDSMNVVLSANDSAGEDVAFNVVRVEREPQTLHALIPVCVDRKAIHEPPRMSLDEAERLI
jgi:hypothetical protein